MSNALAIFAKAPIVGQVKTRLCPPLSYEQAAELFQGFLLDTVERMSRLPEVQLVLAITPADSEPLFRKIVPAAVRYVPQRGASLGERQTNLFVDVLAEGFKKVVLIGSDIPTLPAAHIQAAFTQLNDAQTDAVFGPSNDGGYYLVGARKVHQPLFEDISWSTSQVWKQTLEQARRNKLSIACVPAWYDVDTADDLQRLASDAKNARGLDAVPRTRELLTRLGFISA